MAVATGAACAVIAIVHTLRDENRWPFTANNMFNRSPGAQFPQLRMQLHDGEQWTELGNVYGLLPFEFFRTVEILAAVYLDSPTGAVSEDRRAEFTRRLLEGMERGWHAFDEIEPPPPAPRGRRWEGLRLLLVTIDLERFDPIVDGPLDDISVIHEGWIE